MLTLGDTAGGGAGMMEALVCHPLGTSSLTQARKAAGTQLSPPNRHNQGAHAALAASASTRRTSHIPSPLPPHQPAGIDKQNPHRHPIAASSGPAPKSSSARRRSGCTKGSARCSRASCPRWLFALRATSGTSSCWQTRTERSAGRARFWVSGENRCVPANPRDAPAS